MRVLCALAFVLLLAGLVVASIVGGKDSPAGDVWGPMLLAFALVTVALGAVWLMAGARAALPGVAAHRGKIAAAVVVVALVVASRMLVNAPAGVGEVAAVQPGESTPAVASVEEVARVGCACAEGKACAGPRGGRYCTNEGGGKRYLAGADK
ncbi:MAG: hypothetical protein ACOYBP_09170 [Microbacteriaceae bacterium]